MSATVLRMADYRRARLRVVSDRAPMSAWYEEIDAAMRELARAQEAVAKRYVEMWCKGMKWPM